MSVAAIDVGSSAIRLLIVQIGTHGLVLDTFTQRYPIRLGADVFATGAIGAETTARLIEAFADCSTHLRDMGVHRYRAVATSAMRDAANSAEVVRRVRAETGLDIEVVSGAEEGRLIRYTLMRALGSVPRDALLIDLGGGSLELERGTGVRGRSLPFGTVRLLHRFPELANPMSPRAVAALQQVIESELRQSLRRVRSAELAIATGGNLETLARLAPRARMAVPTIDVRRLAPLCRRIASMTTAERSACFGIRADRADLILPAALVMRALAAIFEPGALIVPGTGIREAVLQTLVTDEMRARHTLTAMRRPTFLASTRARVVFEASATGTNARGTTARGTTARATTATGTTATGTTARATTARATTARGATAGIVATGTAKALALRVDRSVAERRALLAQRLFGLLAAQHRLWPPAAMALVAGAALIDAIGPEVARLRTAELRARLLAMRVCPSDDDAARLAVAAALVACGAPLRAKCAVSAAERHAARTLAAILQLAAALAARGAPTSLQVSLLRDPIVIEVGLGRQLTHTAVLPLERALGRRIRVR